MKKLVTLLLFAAGITTLLHAQSQFTPDLSKAYYIDCPAEDLRLAANGATRPYTTSTATTGPEVQWRFVTSPSADYYFIQCDGGGSSPRIRSDQTEFANMVSVTAEGSWVRWRTDSAAPESFFLTTLQDTPYDRLQVTSDGTVRITDNLNMGDDLKFSFTIVEGVVSDRSSYHVSKAGDDDNDGSPEAPFLTITKASSLASAGDTVLIHEGTYREMLSPANSGSAGMPILFTNYADDSVLVMATEAVIDWQVHSTNIYSAEAIMPLQNDNMIFFDWEAMDRARWPNNTDGNVFTIDAHPVVSGGSASSITTSDVPDMDWTGGFIWYLGAHSGASWTRPILSATSSTITFPAVDITKWPFSTHNPTVYRNGNRGRFFLFGVMGALDHEQEWFYNNTEGKVYFYAPGGVDPVSAPVEATRRSHSIFIGKDHIHVDGIDAFGGRVEIEASNCVIRNGEFIHCLQVMDDLDNTSAQSSNGSLYIVGNDILIENNRIEHSSLNGILVQGWGGGQRIEIRNNYIQHCNSVGIHASPIRSGGSNSKVISNTIRGTGRDGIYCSGQYNEVAYNDVSHCMKINNDGGLYYTVGNDEQKHTEIHHNWFHDTEGPYYADGRAAGIYLDNNSKGYDVHHNVVWNISWSGLQINWLNTHINFYHNTLWETSAAIGRWDNNYDEFENKVWNNYSDRGDWSSADFIPDLKSNVINAGSLFESIPEENFIPLANSLLVDGATPIDDLPLVYTGSGPDIGAYERGLTPWIPGVNTVYGGEEDLILYNYLRNAVSTTSDSITTSSEETRTFTDTMVKLDSTELSWQVLDTLRQESTRNDTLFVDLTYIDSTFTSKIVYDSTFSEQLDSVFTYLTHEVTDTVFYDSIFVSHTMRSFEAESYTAFDTLLAVLYDLQFTAADSSVWLDTLVSETFDVEIIPQTGIHVQALAPLALILYPNPLGQHHLRVEVNGDARIGSAAILDLTGKIIYQRDNDQGIFEIPRSAFPAEGLYFIRIKVRDQVLIRKIVVE